MRPGSKGLDETDGGQPSSDSDEEEDIKVEIAGEGLDSDSESVTPQVGTPRTSTFYPIETIDSFTRYLALCHRKRNSIGMIHHSIEGITTC